MKFHHHHHHHHKHQHNKLLTLFQLSNFVFSKKGEYDIWAMKMEHYLAYIDYPIWEVIQNGNGPVSITTDTQGQIKVLPPRTVEEILARERERKTRTTSLMALPEDYLAKFHKMTDAKEMWEAIKSRFGGNDESKKMQKFQSILSQLKIHEVSVSTEDANQKFLRSLPSAWSQVSLIMRTKPGVDSLSFDDLYNNLRVFENDVKGSTASSSSTQNVAFVSENTSSTNDVSTAYGVSNPSGQNSQYEHTSSYSLLANQSSCPQLDHEDLEQLDEFDLEEMDLKWQVAMISMRMKKFYKKTGRKLQFDAKEPVGFDKTKVECYNCHKTGHFARECRTKGNQDNRRRDAWNSGNKDGRRSGKQEDSKALVTIDGEGVDWTSHSEEEEDYALMACNSSGSDTEIRFMKIDLDDKTDVLTYHKKLLAEAQKEKEDLKAKVEKWHNSSKNLGKLLNTQMSANDKFGLGYGDHIYDGILSYENEVLHSVFMSKESELENQPLYDRFVTAGGMHAVPPPMIGNYMPSRPDVEIDYSQFTYDCSIETQEPLPEPTVNEPKIVSQPKVWSNAPIIEEYESDSEDEHVSLPTEEQETPSFANQDCDFHEKRMAKQAELNNRMKRNSSQREICPIWNNVQRVTHINQFVPTAVLTRTGKIPVNTAIASGTNNVSTARHKFNRQAVLTNVAMKVNTVKPIVNRVRPATVFHKTHSPFSRPFNNTTSLRTNFTKQKVNTAEVNAVSAVGGKGKLLLSPQQVVIGDNKDTTGTKHMTGNKAYLAEYQNFNGGLVAFGGSKGYITAKGGLPCLIAKATIDESNKWHRRLGHVNFKNLNKLVKGNLVRGLPSKIFQNDHTCVACQKGKQHKASYKAKSVSSISHSLQLLHMDLFGPTSVRSLNHKTYCLVITDDFSRFSWVFFLRTKDETSGILKDFIRQIENQLNQKVKTIRCDNGTEFKNRDFIEFCGSKGIKREYSNARTPQQNGVAERKNRTLIEAARTMLADSFLPNTFWAEAVSTACYVLNRVLVTKPHNKTPYELVTGKIPIISYIRPFGCHVTILNTIDHLGKFDGKSDEGFLVGYSLQSKAFRVYNLETKRVEENLHITFLENKPNVAGKGPTWLFDLDYLTDSMNYQPVRSENQANKHAGDSEKEDESAQDYFVLPIWSSYSSTVKRSTAKDAGEAPNKHPDLKTDEKPVDKEDQVFLDELERLKRQEQDANNAAEALRKEFAQETKDLLLQAGAAKTSSTNIVNNVSTPVSTASPYGGLTFTDLTNPDQDDSEIPALEEIYDNPTDGIFTNSSYDDEGAVADFTNLEPIVNVSPIPTSRINYIHPLTLILGDPQLAVQTRNKVTKSSGAHAFVSYIQKQRRNNHKDFRAIVYLLGRTAAIQDSKSLDSCRFALWEEGYWNKMGLQEELLQFKILKVSMIFVSLCIHSKDWHERILEAQMDAKGSGIQTGRKSAKAEPSVLDSLFDELPKLQLDFMVTDDVLKLWWRTRSSDEEKENCDDEVSTEDVLSTCYTKVSTDKESTVDQTKGRRATPTTPTTTPTIFGDDETIAQVSFSNIVSRMKRMMLEKVEEDWANRRERKRLAEKKLQSLPFQKPIGKLQSIQTYLMEILHIFDRQDLYHLYNLMMEQYSEITLEGIELILWGDLKIMMESSTEGNDQSDFWDDQQDWKIVTWRLYEACGVCILEFEDGTIIHMLVERRYPLYKDLLQRMLDLGLEVERESIVALDLIRFIKQQIDEE
ncbi:putative ribonuclease H-like domain-containing protein [Tanacetum coccineum]|uniref:Ribonuclease H-like domain-containing protein n=1 Tax=Tanacetum coccineum TaxID=301880 RepID=A0ABQ5BJP1_9ASTR